MKGEIVNVKMTKEEAGVVYLLVSQTIECQAKFRQFNADVKNQMLSIQGNLHKLL